MLFCATIAPIISLLLATHMSMATTMSELSTAKDKEQVIDFLQYKLDSWLPDEDVSSNLSVMTFKKFLEILRNELCHKFVLHSLSLQRILFTPYCSFGLHFCELNYSLFRNFHVLFAIFSTIGLHRSQIWTCMLENLMTRKIQRKFMNMAIQ